MTTATFGNVVRGVAFGDAWGDPHEFASIESIIKDSENGPDLPQNCRITDDTQMTLFLADALDLTANDDIPAVKKAIIDAFLDYKNDPDSGSRAPGITVMGSLGSLRGGYNWKSATNRGSDGSGTIMRTSPTAFLPEDRWLGATAFAAAVTHGAANSMAAAILQAKLIRDLRDGLIFTDQLTLRAFELASDPTEWGLNDIPDIWLEGFDVDLDKGFAECARLLGLALEDLPELIAHPWDLGADSDPSHLAWFNSPNGAGWRAHHTLVCAVMAIDMFPGDPWNGLRRAANSDGDSDTIGAVAGALLGAAHPNLFLDKWATLGNRFEPRYIAWIENEADDYDFDPEVEADDPNFVPADEAEAAALTQSLVDAEEPEETVEDDAVSDSAEEQIDALETPAPKRGFLARWIGKSARL